MTMPSIRICPWRSTSSPLRVALGPLGCGALVRVLVLCQLFSDAAHQRVRRIGVRQQRTHRQQHLRSGKHSHVSAQDLTQARALGACPLCSAKACTGHSQLLCDCPGSQVARYDQQLCPLRPPENAQAAQAVRAFDIVSAGLHWSLRMSRQICPWLLILQWYIRVLNTTCANSQACLSASRGVHMPQPECMRDGGSARCPLSA